MTIDVKGFVQIPEFRNNAENSISAIGQLSLESRTFARDRQEYSDDTNDISDLVIFHCEDDGVKAIMPADARTKCMAIMEKAYNEFNASKSFKEQLEAAFPDFTDVDTGPDQVHLGRAFCTWFSFKYELAGEVVKIKLWLSDTSFRSEWPHYEIVVVPPTNNVQDLHSSYDVAKNSSDGFTLPLRFSKHSAVTKDDPDTDTRIVSIGWVDPSDPLKNFTTDWSIIGYGPLAFVHENMITAIQDHLTDNSPWPLSDWVNYLPELDSIDVVYIFPQWDNVALSSSVTPGEGDNLYSTVMRYDVGMDNMRKFITDTSLTGMKKYTDVISSVFKSIMLATVGKESNSLGKQRVSDIFPKYATLNLNDGNNGRLNDGSAEFAVQLNRVLILAEKDDGTITLPAGFTRQVTGPGTFIEFVMSGITFRLCTKPSYLDSI